MSLHRTTYIVKKSRRESGFYNRPTDQLFFLRRYDKTRWKIAYFKRQRCIAKYLFHCPVHERTVLMEYDACPFRPENVMRIAYKTDSLGRPQK